MSKSTILLPGWQTGEASFREIAPLVIERIPGLEHGPPYAPGVIAKIAELAASNRPTVYGVIRDLREGRKLEGATAAKSETPPAAPVVDLRHARKTYGATSSLCGAADGSLWDAMYANCPACLELLSAPAAETAPEPHQMPSSASEAVAGPSVAMRPVGGEHAPANGNGHHRPALSSAERWDALRLAAGVGELADVRDLPTWAAQLDLAAQLAQAAESLL